MLPISRVRIFSVILKYLSSVRPSHLITMTGDTINQSLRHFEKKENVIHVGVCKSTHLSITVVLIPQLLFLIVYCYYDEFNNFTT